MSETAPQPICCVCKQPKSHTFGLVAELIRQSLFDFIRKRMPQCDDKNFICFDDLSQLRKEYVKEVLQDEIGELSTLDEGHRKFAAKRTSLQRHQQAISTRPDIR